MMAWFAGCPEILMTVRTMIVLVMVISMMLMAMATLEKAGGDDCNDNNPSVYLGALRFVTMVSIRTVLEI